MPSLKIANQDTISAIATAPGTAAIGIVRVSGSDAFALAEKMFRRAHPKPLESHRIYVGEIMNPETGVAVDRALLLVFKAPNSYTGEDCVEFSCHGGSAVLRQALELTWRFGARPAEPGEFTLRAFMNGKLDLAQAEAVADLIHARAEAQGRAALELHKGALSQQARYLSDRALSLLASVEAVIDFSEEIGDLNTEALQSQIQELIEETETLLKRAEAGRLLREGVRLAIIGQPNVGKSSLLNALLEEERAIVTEVPGTTRDVIEESFLAGGIPFIVQDTAGLRNSEDTVERIGIERTRQAIENADALLFVFSAHAGWTEADQALWETLPDKPALLVANKIDLLDTPVSSQPTAIPVSALTGIGLEDLRHTLLSLLDLQDLNSENLPVTHARHANALREAADHLRHALHTIDQALPPDFLSIDLRSAWLAYGQITGETVEEDLIHRIFRDFCIGK